MRISDWSSDVCSSDLVQRHYVNFADLESVAILGQHIELRSVAFECGAFVEHLAEHGLDGDDLAPDHQLAAELLLQPRRSEEHTSELQSLMRISYAVFCLKKKKKITHVGEIIIYDKYKKK